MNGILWNAFYRPPTEDIYKMFLQYLIGWDIDLMVLFIERVILRQKYGHTRFKYVAILRVNEENNKMEVDHRYKDQLHPGDYSAFIFLVYFIKRDGKIAVGTIFIEGSYLDFFLPFTKLTLTTAVLNQIKSLAPNFLGKQNLTYRRIQFPHGLYVSNLWNIHYILLHLDMKFDDIQGLFNDKTKLKDLLNKAVITYKGIGKLIGDCVKYNAEKKNNPRAKAAMTFFSPRAIKPFIMNSDAFNSFKAFFLQCRIGSHDIDFLDDLYPRDIPKVTPWPAVVDSIWERFKPIDGAKDPRFYF